MRSLAANEASRRPRYIICVDAESNLTHTTNDRIVHTFKMGSALYWEVSGDHRQVQPDKLDFDTLDVFWDWVETHVYPKTKTYLWSHNIDYDLATLAAFHHLPHRGWVLQYLCTQPHARIYQFGKPTEGYTEFLEAGGKWGAFAGRKWTATLVCLDSMNIFPGSIKAWGDLLGIPKLEMPAPDALLIDWQAYNRRDVEILRRMIQSHLEFLDKHDMGNFKSTLPGQAFTAYRHRFMQHRIFTHEHPAAIALERSGYLGGRVEPFYLGTPALGPIYQVDVNSMYPHVMTNCDYPTCLIHHSKETSVADLQQRLQHHCVMARVTVNVTEPVFPYKTDKHNVYPTGRFDTVLSTPEISYALQQGWIEEVHEIAQYNARQIFTRYVDFFYGLKQQADSSGDKLHRAMAKMYLNSLYGKFGQKGYKDEITGTCPIDTFTVTPGYDVAKRQYITQICVGGTITYTWQEGEGPQSFVAIAAHVTAQARLYLWRLITIAGRENVLYVDTDCLFVTETGYHNLRHLCDPVRLGALKLEAIDDHPEFRAPKDYSFNQQTVRKGVPLTAPQTTASRFNVTLWPSLTNLWQHQITDHYENFVISKRLRYDCNWGELQPDGWVRPYHLT
jgi:hypothetical protein